MRRAGAEPDHYTFPFLLKACGELSSLQCGAAVHGVVFKLGFESNVFACNALVTMYARCGSLGRARKVFDEISERGIDDAVSWNSMVAALVKGGEDRHALVLFGSMRLRPGVVSLVNVLPACGSLRALAQVKEIHGYAARNKLLWDVFVGNAIVDVYAKCGDMDAAVRVFDGMEVRDVVSWNAMVTGYSQSGRFEEAFRMFDEMRERRIELNVVTWSAVIAGFAQRGRGREALDVFREMQGERAEPNEVTIISLLSGCAALGALRHGMETHGYAAKMMLGRPDGDDGNDLMVKNALIDMYAKCQRDDLAKTMFDSVGVAERNVVTWTVMIGGYSQHGDANCALQLFSQMLRQPNGTPNAHTMSCALMACARLSALRFGREIHGFVIRNRYEKVMVFINNCFIDMYAKCGDIDTARKVFDRMSEPNSVSWTSLMTGYGLHGRGNDALHVFHRMLEIGLVPDGVTFLVVLYACSHSGLVDRGLHYLRSMESVHGVMPEAEHYACIVDLLGRAGRLDEAGRLIEQMPTKPSPIVWVAYLSGCRLHGKVDLAEHAADKLLELDSENDGSYTLLSNIYANAGRWRDVARIRVMMKKMGIKKRPGCSWVQGKKGMAAFFVGDRRHSQWKEIYEVLADLLFRIKAMGYVPETSFALHDVDDEEKKSLLSEHSEKLALAYGVLNTPAGIPIRITKNLRVCGDCHTAITYISKIVDHEIILRDSSRFHHFREGSCSCGGYW